jgi:hypothetical protein
MAIGFVGANSVSNSTSTLTTVVSPPTGYSAGDLLLALVVSVASSPVSTPPNADWKLVASFQPGTTLTSYLYRKIAVAGEPAGTWAWTSSGRNVGLVMAYSGVGADVAITTDQVWTHDVPAGPIAAPALGANPGGWLITAAVGRENPGTATAKDWAIATATDVQRLDVATAGAAADIKVSGAWFDSNAAVVADSTARSVTVTPVLQQSHVWSILLTAPTAPEDVLGGNPWTSFGILMGSNGINPVTAFVVDRDGVLIEITSVGIAMTGDVLTIETTLQPATPDGDVLSLTV